MPPSFAPSPATTPVVVGCCRTAIGRAHPDRGVFRRVRGDELAAAVVRAVRNAGGLQKLWLNGNGADDATEARAREELSWVGQLFF